MVTYSRRNNVWNYHTILSSVRGRRHWNEAHEFASTDRFTDTLTHLLLVPHPLLVAVHWRAVHWSTNVRNADDDKTLTGRPDQPAWRHWILQWNGSRDRIVYHRTERSSVLTSDDRFPLQWKCWASSEFVASLKSNENWKSLNKIQGSMQTEVERKKPKD